MSSHHTLPKLSTLEVSTTGKSISPNLRESPVKPVINKPLTSTTHQYFWCLVIGTAVCSCWHAAQKKKKWISCFLDTIVQLFDKLHPLWSERSWTFLSAYLIHTPRYEPDFLYFQLQEGLEFMLLSIKYHGQCELSELPTLLPPVNKNLY